MKKIVPFNNVLTFDTDVASITAISLEHEIKKSMDSISGVFTISGEYKITDGQLDSEKFNFELPFDIALGSNYNLDTLEVDIDDFRYELTSRNNLKVNIDLYLDGEVIEEPIEINDEVVSVIEDEPVINEENNNEEVREDDLMEDLVNELVTDNKEDIMKDTEININNNDNSNDNDVASMFDGNNYPENYVTYRVYRVLEGDNIDKIIEKYETTKEELMKYNNTLDIKVGDKLIIPANDK